MYQKHMKSQPSSLFVGLMSGTSMDGIDVALVDVLTHRLIKGMTIDYDAEVRCRLQTLMHTSETSLKALSQLHTLLGREFARAVQTLLQSTDVPVEDVIAIGSHGQTVCHDTCVDVPYTMQLGCAHTIAHLTGLPVVADFRTADLILGGQGAPLAPVYHRELFQSMNVPLAVVNIGGIANVTYLPGEDQILGYDIGPGNCLIDAWIARHLNQSYDADGAWSLSGKINESLLHTLLTDPYFQKKPPKSLGKEYYSLAWLETHLPPSYVPADIQATLLALTAHSIARDIKQSTFTLERLLICGGGVHNRALMQVLKQLLPHLSVDSTEVVGVSPDYLEAMMFAWFAAQRLNQTPLDLTKLTKAYKPHLAGVLYTI